MGAGAVGSARREVLSAETGAAKLPAGLTSIEGSESLGVEAALRPFTLGAARRTWPSEGFLGCSTAGARLFAAGMDSGFAVREGGNIGVAVKFELREIAGALVSGCTNPESPGRELGATGVGCMTGVEVKFELCENVGADAPPSGAAVSEDTAAEFTGAGAGEADETSGRDAGAAAAPGASDVVAPEREPPSDPEMALPGCCEYQNPPAITSSPAAMPIESPVRDLEAPISDAEEASPSNCPPNTAVSGLCKRSTGCARTSVSGDSGRIGSAATSAGASGKTGSEDAVIIGDGLDSEASVSRANGASHAGICNSSSGDEAGPDFACEAVLLGAFAAGADSLPVAAVSKSCLVTSERFTEDCEAEEESESALAGFDSVKSSELSCSCKRAACCLSSSVVEFDEETGTEDKTGLASTTGKVTGEESSSSCWGNG